MTLPGPPLILAYITPAQSFANILLAAAISTLLLGIGLYGRRVTSTRGGEVNIQRRVRTLWILAGIIASLMTLYVARIESTPYYRRDTNEAIALSAAVFVGLIGGLVLILVGLRGRWVGEHPHCRRCGFDLFGKPPESTICNECGADLTAPRATSIGLHHRRLIPLLAGAFVLTVTLAIGVSVGSTLARSPGRVSLTSYTPTWWLIRQLNAKNVSPETERELLTRLQRGKLSSEQMEQIVQRAEAGGSAMALIADQFAFDAWERGQLSEGTARRAVKRQLMLNGSLVAQSVPTRINYRVYPSFLSAGPLRSRMAYSAKDFVCEINGQRVPASCVQTSFFTAGTPFAIFGDIVQPPSPLPAGPATLKLTAHVTLTYAAPSRPPLTEEQDVTLIDATTMIVDRPARPYADYDASYNSGINAFVRLSPTEGGGTKLVLNCTAPPRMIFTGTAALRSRDGRQRELGAIAIDGGTGSLQLTLPPPALDPTFQVVLRPATPPADPSIATVPAPYVPTEIVIDAPLIQRTRATTRPSTSPTTRQH